jgi:hypothetical protein
MYRYAFATAEHTHSRMDDENFHTGLGDQLLSGSRRSNWFFLTITSLVIIIGYSQRLRVGVWFGMEVISCLTLV